MRTHDVFITGGTGYLGQRLIPQLIARGHRVRALARPGSRVRWPEGCTRLIGNALDRRTFAHHLAPGDTLIQLVGTPRPSPAKARQFREVDLVAGREAVAAAVEVGVRHLVYVSVAQPASVMKAYIAVRAEVEALIRESRLDATILRPWYVLGPGHRWPYLLLPVYWLLERLPAARDGARRLGLVTLEQMVRALVAAVETPPHGTRIMTVPEIRASRLAPPSESPFPEPGPQRPERRGGLRWGSGPGTLPTHSR